MKSGFDVTARLVTWFHAHARPMPWRLEVTPYGSYVSEIMMQQTTYEQALPYYRRFLKRFPTVGRLAAADEQDVLKVWEGLGYYARARNLLKAARQIAAHGWPTTLADWQALPGVGSYTAAALASVLNGVRTPVVDGNVVRVFSRFWHLGGTFKDATERARLAARLQPLVERADVPGDFNQGMMELGALVCTPTQPRCEACPLAAQCAAHKRGDAASYPAKPARAPLPVRRRTFLVIPDGTGRILLVQNREGGLLKGLWELPTAEALKDGYSQTFTHFRLEADVYRLADGAAVEFRDPSSVPLTTAARRMLGL